ncbi:MAG: aminoacyl-tRNA hydrolase [Planctomycetes bacterium]|nr:aminoacyl-tRNA hydrolase [Planctomycetota bacterium]
MSADREVRVRPGLVIPASALEIRFSRSGGPGGQNVNKVETRAEVLFDLAGSPLLGEEERRRALGRLAPRLTNAGRLDVACDRTRHRERNLREALQRMGEILREALARPKRRRPTAPTRGSRERRLGEKRRRSEVKRARGTAAGEE